ncbi:MAG: response regulator transcription factor [Planctomycetes bacterium]|nr:response regulator transcription factor [Planctomycetota bacterium]MBL7042726.1 response regulator transcription factor [Pirellulaceae bacterium]
MNFRPNSARAYPSGKVIVVDDDKHAVDQCRRVLESVGFAVRAYESAEEYLDSNNSSRAACLIIEEDLPGASGLELQRRLCAQPIHPPIIFVSRHGHIPTVVKAIKSGADDYLKKPMLDGTLRQAVHRAVQGDRQRHRAGRGHSQLESRLEQLSPRERDVLPLICHGKTNRQIAAEFGICYQTAWRHRRCVLQKLGVKGEVELMWLFHQHPTLLSWVAPTEG